jgi:hypothetical protein
VATNYVDLIPTSIARDVVGRIADSESALMQLARVERMPSGVEKVPVVTAAPTSGFVNPAYGGLKPGTSLDWQSEVLTAGEIACVLAIPNAFLDDTKFPVWQSVRDEIAKSFTNVLEQAALYGTNAPADWPAATSAPAGRSGSRRHDSGRVPIRIRNGTPRGSSSSPTSCSSRHSRRSATGLHAIPPLALSRALPSLRA